MKNNPSSGKSRRSIEDNGRLKTDFIQCESTSDTIEIHRGRNGYEWSGQKGKTLEWTIPVLVEKSADEILNKIYNSPEWQRVGSGVETSIDSPALREVIWNHILPNIDIKAVRTVKRNGNNKDAMVRTKIKGTYIIEDKRTDTIIGSNECYTFYQSVEMVANWFLKNINKDYFLGKVVYLNADDTRSAFWLYFYNNFKKLGLKELIATHYDGSGLSCGNAETNIKQIGFWDEYAGYILRYDGKQVRRIPPLLTKSTFHGDYREKVCMDIARNEADIIMTNPPFGKNWEQYVKCMLETGKKLIFWGNGGAPLYTWFMPFLNQHKVYIVDKVSHVFETDHYMTPNYWKKNALGFIYTTEDLSGIYKPEKKNYSTKAKMLMDGTAWYARLTTMSGSKWKKEHKNLGFIRRFLSKKHTAPYEAKVKVLCCDNALIPTDTNEILAVSVNIIKHGILNAGYKIVDYHCYGTIKGEKLGFGRVLIKKT